MIFVIRTGNKRSEEELATLHNRLLSEINTDTKHKVMCLPPDCWYTFINDYDSSNAKVVISEED